MLVQDYMTRHPLLVGPERRAVEAQQLLVANKVSQLPVVGDGKRLLGLVTAAGLAVRPEQLASMNVWELSAYLGQVTVGQVMTPAAQLPVVTPQDTLEDTAAALIGAGLRGLPVVEDGVVVGVITETDLLVELRNLLGAIDAGWRVVVRVPDRMGEFRKLVQLIAGHEWGIMAMGCVRSPKHPGHWDIVAKVRHCTREALLAALAELPDQVVVDIRETRGDKG